MTDEPTKGKKQDRPIGGISDVAKPYTTFGRKHSEVQTLDFQILRYLAV